MGDIAPATKIKFLIYGGKGWIGQGLTAIIERAGDDCIHGRRVNTIEDVKKDLLEHDPDIVISSLGRTFGPGFNSIDYLEQKGKLLENLHCNLVAPVLIAQATADKRTPVLYIGSGCIFEYDATHVIGGPGFTEDDLPNFFGSSYSTVKGQTDQILKAYSHVLTARIRMPICNADHPRDFITKILKYQKIASIPNSMTILADFLPFLVASVVERKSGIINAVNPGIVDHEQILKMHEEVNRKKLNYKLMSLEEQSTMLLAGRSNNTLTWAKAEEWLLEIPQSIKAKYGCPLKFGDIKQRIRDLVEYRKRLEELSATQPDKVLLVTGGAGFIGSNFINYWVEKYPEDMVVNLDRLERHGNLKNIRVADRPNYEFVRGDLNNQEQLSSLFTKHQFTHVVHFAAASSVDESFQSPLACTQSNVVGTHVLLEIIRRYGKLSLLVLISTDEVYGEVSEGLNSEMTSIFQPTNPYAASKAGAECLLMAYGKSYHIPYVITRANNVYGTNQYPTQVIPRFIMSLVNGQKMPVQGTGEVTRRFLHVHDKCRAINLIIEKGKLAEVYNIGVENEISVMDLCRLLLAKIHGKSSDVKEWVQFVPDRPYNDCRYAIDASKLEKLGWKPQIQFDQGIDETIKWYKENLGHWTKSNPQ